ncbi:protein max isoform X1 [Maniola hyperantus]|uniref:protein max isoform X1 n=1 Tax=Aphantopus hyperantus TaxID=2795564 RepID=UPI00156909FE|nr:protein max isoform X1 [Maniola hyperantus]XP_034834323.1 protein max isoform X1 [Maniola hyperantus]
MMSDDDRDIDIESDAENDSDSRPHARSSLGGSGYYSQAEKRAHHNALERKRRDHIKDSFTSLRDAVPALQGEKVVCASRAQILKKAAEYIQFMRRKNNAHQQDIDDLRRQNTILETQIRALEKARATGNYMDAHELGLGIKSEGSSHDTDSSDGEGTTRRVKKLKINSVNV